jgi:carbonic anhydrase/acetyltransferase-like protein (isoleucine patch superfamily)
VLDKAVVQKHAVVAPGAVVTPGKVVPTGQVSMWSFYSGKSLRLFKLERAQGEVIIC